MKNIALHTLEPHLVRQLPIDQRDAIERRASACMACSSCQGFERFDVRCGMVAGKRLSLTLGRCKLRKWPAFVMGDEIVLPESSDSLDEVQQLLYGGKWRWIDHPVYADGFVCLQKRSYSPGVTLITPTGDRPESIRLCVRWMRQQRLAGIGPIQWIVVDDGDEAVDLSCFAGLADKGWAIDHYRREPRDDDPPHTLCLNMRVALPQIKHDKILIIEDDDYYSPDYVATVCSWLERADLVGETSANLYFLQSREYQCFQNSQIAGWCKTGFRPAVIPTIWHAVLTSDQHALDLRVWRGWSGTKYLVQDDSGRGGFCIGIKGVPGRRGHTWSHDGNVVDDPLLIKLNDWIGQDLEHYMELLGD